MKPSTLYVILEIYGSAFVVTERDKEKVSLPQLLEDGWRPVSETSMGNAPAVLIRLEKDHEGKLGFGFGSQ